MAQRRLLWIHTVAVRHLFHHCGSSGNLHAASRRHPWAGIRSHSKLHKQHTEDCDDGRQETFEIGSFHANYGYCPFLDYAVTSCLSNAPTYFSPPHPSVNARMSLTRSRCCRGLHVFPKQPLFEISGYRLVAPDWFWSVFPRHPCCDTPARSADTYPSNPCSAALRA